MVCVPFRTADAIGGRLEIESEPGRGTVVHGIIDIDKAT
jgi:hypothetical protein